MLTSQNDDLRWILATIVESGNHQFWGWLVFVTFFGFYFSCVRGTKKNIRSSAAPTSGSGDPPQVRPEEGT